MGSLKKGILSGIKGKVGTVVGSTWRGVDYIRSAGGKRRKGPGTEEQEIQRAKFKLVAAFCSVLAEVLEFGYSDSAQNMTGRNSAVGYILDTAVIGQHPNWQLDYPNILVTAGTRPPNALTPAAACNAPAKIDFTWGDNSGISKAKDTDVAVIVAYCEELEHCDFKITEIKRSAQAVTLNLHPALSGKKVHTWLSFATADKKRVSKSAYTGELLVL